MGKKSEYRLRPDNRVEDLRRELAIEGSDLAINVGRRAIYRRPGVEPFEVMVSGVQKRGDDDGNYRFGVEGYTVRRGSDEWSDQGTRA